MKRRQFLKRGSAAAGAAAIVTSGREATAQTREETLRVLAEGVPNTLDPAGDGANRDANGCAWNIYDRLVSFDRMEQGAGAYHYDYYKIRGEVAESWQESSTGNAITFKIRAGATFHDGSPITAEDVKWSLDRAVNVPVSKRQLSTGSLTAPEQFVVVDAQSVRVDLPRKDRFALPNLAIVFPAIFNSKLCKANATAQDPWATEWLKGNTAGGGGYRIEQFTPGQQVTFARNDAWKNGKLPHYRRVIHQLVPTPASRLTALERGDADIALGLPPKDMDSLAGKPGVKIVSVPMRNAFQLIGMEGNTPPFDNVKVRQAVAAALPYKAMFDGVLFGRGRQLTGGSDWTPKTTEWPAPQPYSTDYDRAKKLLAEAGHANGFETTLTFNIAEAATAEPLAVLVQESLARVGIKVTINKVPNATMGTLLTEKKIPFFFEQSAAWLNDPDYFFRIFYNGATRWNFGSFKHPEMDKLIADSRFEADQARYDAMVKRMIEIVYEQAPVILLWQPSLDVPMRSNISGYTYYFHRQVDYRALVRA
jgi:peptide/nickel transport system substrate-binding protein